MRLRPLRRPPLQYKQKVSLVYFWTVLAQVRPPIQDSPWFPSVLLTGILGPFSSHVDFTKAQSGGNHYLLENFWIKSL